MAHSPNRLKWALSMWVGDAEGVVEHTQGQLGGSRQRQGGEQRHGWGVEGWGSSNVDGGLEATISEQRRAAVSSRDRRRAAVTAARVGSSSSPDSQEGKMSTLC